MLRLAEVGPADVVYDLGSGDGRLPITAAQEFGARGVGIDIDPQRIRESAANARAAGVSDRVHFRNQDMFEADIRDATVVTLFLSPELNLKLRRGLFRQLRPGTRVVSYYHDTGDWAPLRTVPTPERISISGRSPARSRRSSRPSPLAGCPGASFRDGDGQPGARVDTVELANFAGARRDHPVVAAFGQTGEQRVSRFGASG